MLERGVRHVQLFSGGSFGSPRINWDGHEDMKRNHGREALRIDQPVAALIKDLKSRGMLDETLVMFTSEFGRTPFTQSALIKSGRVEIITKLVLVYGLQVVVSSQVLIMALQMI